VATRVSVGTPASRNLSMAVATTSPGATISWSGSPG
jgi:hypothetical protein